MSARLTCITAQQTHDAAYLDLLARGAYTGVVPEYEQQWGQIHPGPQTWAWTPTDTIVSFARSKGLTIEGHTLVWGAPDYPDLMPTWITTGTWSRESLLAVLREHISCVVHRYRDDIHTWRVVNEAFDEQGRRRDFVMQRVIGEDWVEHAFRFAHAADPTATLLYNDYGLEWGALHGGNREYDAVLEMVRDFLRRAVPIHGIGLQCHFDLQYSQLPHAADFSALVRSFAELGLRVQATELDVRLDHVAEDRSVNLRRQESVVDLVCDTIDAYRTGSVCVWGLSDGTNWLGAHATAAPYDVSNQPKPMAHRLGRVTRARLPSDRSGRD